MKVFKHLRLHRSTQRSQPRPLLFCNIRGLSIRLSEEVRWSLEDSPVLFCPCCSLYLQYFTNKKLRVCEFNASGECFAALHFFDQNHEGLAQLALTTIHEWAWLTLLHFRHGAQNYMAELQRDKGVWLEKSLSTQTVVRRSLADCFPYFQYLYLSKLCEWSVFYSSFT